MFALLLSSFSLFAGGANEGNIYYFPRTIVDNRNMMIELAGEHNLNASDIVADFQNSSKDNLAFFRLRDSLRNVTGNSNVEIKIKSLDNWKFIHETNTNSTRSFELEVFCTEQTRYNRSYSPSSPVELSSDDSEAKTLIESDVSVRLEKSGDIYKLKLPTTSFTHVVLSYYSDYIRDFDFCIVLDAFDGDYLESGYYTTRLEVEIPNYIKSVSRSFWGYSYLEDVSGDLQSFEITLRGYVGITPEMSADPFFIVNSTNYTYNMDLAKNLPDNGYHIANIKFTHSEISNTDPDNVPETNKGQKYKIYISPTNIYSQSGKYYFIKDGTENEARSNDITVYYDLYLANTDGSSRTIITSAPNSSSAYSFYPTFTSSQISSAGMAGGINSWKFSWSLDKDLYLKVVKKDDFDTAKCRPGLYYSYIYFTLVSN